MCGGAHTAARQLPATATHSAQHRVQLEWQGEITARPTPAEAAAAAAVQNVPLKLYCSHSLKFSILEVADFM